MDFSNPVARRAFFELHRDLPRQGPGNRASTARALALAGPLPAAPRILDIGCGPGAQTLDLATLLPDAQITAVDAYAPYLDALRERARVRDLADRIDVRPADLGALPFADASFDLLWCEGAAYNIGVPAALTRWARLLRPEGRLAFTEPAWFASPVPDDVSAFWQVYPAMRDVPALRQLIADAGWTLLGDFTLPEAAWWDDYYGPLAARVEFLAARFESERESHEVLDETRREIALYREHSHCYGYQFFVVAPPRQSAQRLGPRAIG
jgi:SAM-dependent methyltransferase